MAPGSCISKDQTQVNSRRAGSLHTGDNWGWGESKREKEAGRRENEEAAARDASNDI